MQLQNVERLIRVFSVPRIWMSKSHQTFNLSQQCNDAANKANIMLGFIKRNFSFKNKDVILPLFNILVRAHLDYAIQFWFPHVAKDVTKLERV